MAKPLYNEGELGETRSRLGEMSESEAKRMMHVLGGEVGEERADKGGKSTERGAATGKTGVPSKPSRRVEVISLDEEDAASETKRWAYPPAPGYFDRIRMDNQEALRDFKIKTPFQAFKSKFDFFSHGRDIVSPSFVTARMDVYYTKLEKLVNSVRLIFPRNNTERSKKLQKQAPHSYAVLDTIRYWKIERILSSLMRLQSRPRSVTVRDFSDIVREFYKPLFLLELINPEIHIAQAIDDLAFLVQDDQNIQIRGKSTAKEIIFWYSEVDMEIRYRLYPLLLKYVSSVFFSYEVFFTECRTQIFDFLKISPGDRVVPKNNAEIIEPLPAQNKADASANTVTEIPLQFNSGAEIAAEPNTETENKETPVIQGELPKPVLRALSALEQLFPQAGWDNLSAFPDIYPYFAKTISLKKNADIIDPQNPMGQALVLLQILEEFFYGFRAINFTETEFDLSEFLDIIDDWHRMVEIAFERTYIPRLLEFAKLFDSPLENKTRIYAMKVREELNWMTRLCLFPSLSMASISQVPFQKKEIQSIFPKVRTLRRDFAFIAAEIEKSLSAGGAEQNAPCSCIANPWEPYVFQVQNPLSKRLDMLLGKNTRNNVSLIFYTFSTLTALDYLLNNPESWAYKTNTNKLFRSLDEDGLRPAPLPDAIVDADAIFRRSLENRKTG